MRAAGEAEEQVGPAAGQLLRAEGLAILGFKREAGYLGGFRQNVNALGPQCLGVFAHASGGNHRECSRSAFPASKVHGVEPLQTGTSQ